MPVPASSDPCPTDSADRPPAVPGPSAPRQRPAALAARARTAARWRSLAVSLPALDDGLARPIAALLAAECEHAARLARDRIVVEAALSTSGEDWSEAAWPRGGCAGDEAGAACCDPSPGRDSRDRSTEKGAGELARLTRLAAALEDALAHERRLRAAFERLAMAAARPETGLQALGLALAETRQLGAVQEALHAVRRTLSDARNRHRDPEGKSFSTEA